MKMEPDATLRSNHLESPADERTTLYPWNAVDVRRVVEAVAIYPDRADLFRNYPELELDDVQQALAFAAANLEDSAAETSAA